MENVSMLKEIAAALAATRMPLHRWEHPERRSQTCRLIVTKYELNVWPCLQAASGTRAKLNFSAVVTNDAMQNLRVVGDIDAYEPPFEMPDFFDERWRRVPDVVNGWGEHEGPQFMLTLNTTPAGQQTLQHVFGAAFANRSGLEIDVTFTCPNDTGGDFWVDDWRCEVLCVSAWRFLLTAH